MRTVAVTEPGGPSAARLLETERPEVGAGRLRIKVAAAAVHPADLLARSGALAELLPKRPHHRLGWDLAGTVEAVGAEVTGWSRWSTRAS
ncbi:hypothetical protein OG500_20370 [Kitasatospora sp. NBC_01250]|uniref:alcohol dehydrogenase catalytic domain-containing protein n=1 Tax=Kitasatospora sp. NBC_01250 TaxID=2903571 RepID=UPI002E355C39|nr:hypothetical protein [Kitasatospora sp. NBC_01250]